MIKLIGVIIIDTFIMYITMFSLGVITFYPPIKLKTIYTQYIWTITFSVIYFIVMITLFVWFIPYTINFIGL